MGLQRGRGPVSLGLVVESLSTQSLVIFAIRTRRVPFFRSRPSAPLVSTVLVVAVGIALPFSPLAHTLGFTALPAAFLGAVAGMIVSYLLLIELGKRRFYRVQAIGPPLAQPGPPKQRRIHYRASRWSTPARPRRPARPATDAGRA